jgi:hypothetical protein
VGAGSSIPFFGGNLTFTINVAKIQKNNCSKLYALQSRKGFPTRYERAYASGYQRIDPVGL